MTKPASPSRAYPIRAVSRLTGLTPDTLRAWERRYGAVTPTRDGRGRVYSDADIARLRQLALLVNDGHAIGRIARLSDARLAALSEHSAAHRADDDQAIREAPIVPLAAAFDRYDVGTIEATLNRHAAILQPRELVFAVILPLLRELGSRWQDGRLRPAQEHLVSGMVRSVLGGLLRTIARAEAMPRVVFATLPGERHELGLLCAALLSASAGSGVVYLGPDLPAHDVAHAASTTGARVVIISATMASPSVRTATKNLARQVDADLWVGGPAAGRLLDVAGPRARHIQDLEQLVEMLSRHAH
jgi:DNA-binding transcriptional MerR regulator